MLSGVVRGPVIDPRCLFVNGQLRQPAIMTWTRHYHHEESRKGVSCWPREGPAAERKPRAEGGKEKDGAEGLYMKTIEALKIYLLMGGGEDR